MNHITDRQVEQLDQAFQEAQEDTAEMADQAQRMKHIRRNYFPFGRPRDNWPAYRYWLEITDSKKVLERASA
jgi:hypothetical protein